MDGQPKGKPTPGTDPKSARRPGTPVMWMILVALLFVGLFWVSGNAGRRSEIDYSFFHQQVVEGNVLEVEHRGQLVLGKFKDPPLAPSGNAQSGADGRTAEPEQLQEDFIVTLSPLVGEGLGELLLD